MDNEIRELICEGCSGVERGCDGDSCDAYQIAMISIDLFGDEFLEKFDGFILPKQSGKLLRGLRGLKTLKDLALALTVGEMK